MAAVHKTFLIGACCVLLAGPSFAQDAKTAKGSDGKDVLQTPSGRTLYVFDNDKTPGGQPGEVTCYDQCAKLWPAFAAGAEAKPNGDWTIMGRKDGSKQWAYKGRPLYTFVRDEKPGQEQGTAFNGNKWHAAAP